MAQAGGRLRIFLLTQGESTARQGKAQVPGQLPVAPLLQQTGDTLQWWSPFCNRLLHRQGQLQSPGHSLASSTVQHRRLQQLSPAQLRRHHLAGSAWKHRQHQQQDPALLLVMAQASLCRQNSFRLLPEARPRRSCLPSSRLQRAPALLLCLLRSKGLRGSCLLSRWLRLGVAAMLL